MFLLKKSSIVRHKIKFKIEYHNKYLNLKLLISNENNLENLFKYFFLESSLNFSNKQLKI